MSVVNEVVIVVSMPCNEVDPGSESVGEEVVCGTELDGEEDVGESELDVGTVLVSCCVVVGDCDTLRYQIDGYSA
jgi:hypothetical protein